MSDAMIQKTPPPSLSKEAIIEWLRDNPDFLNKNPELYDVLHPPLSKQDKGVVDFQHYMVKRLKSDREQILEEAKEIIDTSRANMNNQSRIHKATLALLEAHSFEDFINTMTMDLISLIDVDIVCLIVETEGDVIPHIDMSGVKMATPGSIANLMQHKPIVLEDNIAGLEGIYGGGCGLVKSQALIYLHIGNNIPPAMLAFGSRDPNMFQEGQGTEQIAFLGHVIERCFRQWLTTPA